MNPEGGRINLGTQQAHKMARKYSQLATVAAFLVIMAAVLVYSFVVRPWFLNWGAAAFERSRALPGDDAVPGLVKTGTRAVTIAAPPEKVWPWLAQIGQDHAGFYSYSWLENIFLADIHNSETLHSEWQDVKTGDFIPSVRPGYFFGLIGEKPGFTGWKVALARPARVLTLAGWGTFVLEARDAGSTRFYARSLSPPAGSVVRFIAFYLLDATHFAMEKRMMLEIKRLAEGRSGPPDWVTPLATLGFVAAALGSLVVVLSRRRKRGWLVLPLLWAALVVWQTSDLQAALVAFVALGLVVAGFAVFGRKWWMFFGLMWVYSYAVLFLADDAYAVFGMVFLAAVIALAVLQILFRPSARPAVART